MPTRDPAWPNHKVHPEKDGVEFFFLRSDSTDYGEENKSWGKVLIGRGSGEGDHGRSDRQSD